jgi:hypothetical protein
MSIEKSAIFSGFDNEEVSERELPKSIGCSKNFRGPDMLDTRAKVPKTNYSIQYRFGM